ncbi:MAG: hypothetical protein AAF902_24800 [Chloroflexota bacterium]
MNGRPDDSLFKGSILVVVCAYFFWGQVFLSGSFSWSPQFNLNTFSKRSAETTRYELRLTEVDGNQFEEPVYFSDASDILTDKDIAEGKSLINKLGIALFDENAAEVNLHRRELERTYFGNFETAKYEIIFIDVNPVEKYSLESFRSERLVSEFNHPMAETIADLSP